jgi:hypothetical protein
MYPLLLVSLGIDSTYHPAHTFGPSITMPNWLARSFMTFLSHRPTQVPPTLYGKLILLALPSLIYPLGPSQDGSPCFLTPLDGHPYPSSTQECIDFHVWSTPVIPTMILNHGQAQLPLQHQSSQPHAYKRTPSTLEHKTLTQSRQLH